ncbi:MAG: hypothetical protein U0174_05245 [Polyangiaceae bacterium]
MKSAHLSTKLSVAPRARVRSFDRTTVRALAEAMFEGGEQALTATRIEEVTDRVFSMIDGAGFVVRFGLRFAIFALWLSPILVGKHFAVLPRLPVGRRLSVLEALERSRVTNLLLMFVGVRAILTMVFYDDAAELAHMGYRATDQTRFARHLELVARTEPAPVPLESGVRLREHAHEEFDSDAEIVAATDIAPHHASHEDVA